MRRWVAVVWVVEPAMLRLGGRLVWSVMVRLAASPVMVMMPRWCRRW